MNWRGVWQRARVFLSWSWRRKRAAMPKLKTLSGREVRSILESHGFAFVSQNGSHMKMKKTDSGAVTTVIVPDHKAVKIGTLSGIVQQSGIGRGPFEA